MEIKMTLENRDEILRTFRKAPGVAAKEYRDALGTIATTVYDKAVKNAPVNKGQYAATGKQGKRGAGGNLRQSIRKFPYGTSGFSVRVGAEYGVYVDQGTKPHVIRPRGKNYLVFRASDGTWVRTTRVNHPGTKPTHFFTNAVKETEAEANDIMRKATDKILKQI
jgi:HK97 gp10 family phage protein